MKQIEIKTRRLILQPIKKADYSVWYEAYVNGAVKKSKWDQDPLNPKLCSLTKFLKFKKRLKDLAKNDDYYRYYIFEKKSGALIGQIDFDIFVRGTHQFANFGFFIFNLHWGKGYGQEAAAAGLKIGFKQLKLNRIEAAINLDNKKSIRLVKAIGMKKEGIKKRYWFEDGQWVDHLIYVANPEDLGLKPVKPF
jgi:ribosomal-protein-alanine N-acetyltransferase